MTDEPAERSNARRALDRPTLIRKAYDKSDPAPLTGDNGRGRTVLYSADPTRYIPLCRPCHTKFDQGDTQRDHLGRYIAA